MWRIIFSSSSRPFFEFLLQFVVRVEVFLDGALALADHEDVLHAAGDGFFDALDRRRVDDRQHFFGLGFRHRQEAGAEPKGRRDHGFADFSSELFLFVSRFDFGKGVLLRGRARSRNRNRFCLLPGA
ncbi:MAG: hypothetical protein R3F11_13140 [Verrucomicrobiales bacterium]